LAGKNDGGDKTEQPTAKRLADARKKGDVPKSRDVTSTVVLFVWLIVLMFGAGYAGREIIGLFDGSFVLIGGDVPFPIAVRELGRRAMVALLGITAVALIPAALSGVISEFLQAGGVFSAEKMKPGLDKMNPVEGIKKMFSMDNFIELVKTLAKAVLIVLVLYLVLRGSLPEILQQIGPQLVPVGETDGAPAAAQVLSYTESVVRSALLWTFGVFLFVAVLDYAWQRHSWIKKLRMSMRDIRQESKENEGDPLIKGNRRQMHREWAEQNAVGAARGAGVLVVNPTHLAIALQYDPESCPIPIMTAKGEGPLAQAMRAAAEEAGVPIIRHVPVARGLYENGAIDDMIPRDMFDAIAQIILWAQKVRDGHTETVDLSEGG
jgi:type III secretion protein U